MHSDAPGARPSAAGHVTMMLCQVTARPSTSPDHGPPVRLPERGEPVAVTGRLGERAPPLRLGGLGAAPQTPAHLHGSTQGAQRRRDAEGCCRDTVTRPTPTSQRDRAGVLQLVEDPCEMRRGLLHREWHLRPPSSADDLNHVEPR